MSRTNEKANTTIKKVVSLILILVLLSCVAGIVIYYTRQHQAAQEYSGLEDDAVTETVTEIATPETTSHGDYQDVPQVDFETLWQTNADIYAWISVPGTQVNYPVAQSMNSTNPYDDYYLNHTITGAEGLPGSIYSEPCNSTDFTDANTVLYGHNMKNGSMFGSLHEYDDDTFFAEHPYIYVVTPEKTLIYQIFAAVAYSDARITAAYDFTNPTSYQLFLDSIYDNKNMADHINTDIDVTTEERILTLSTCINGQETKRWLIEAVLMDEY